MDISEEIAQIIGNPESEQLEYKAVLPPARNIGQLISAFANNNGGIIILGVSETQGQIVVNGLSEDFHANSVTHKALDKLDPKPLISYQYVTYRDKRIYVIKVEKSDSPISIEGKIYIKR
jgi:predicted HTH transcriptional regulator